MPRDALAMHARSRAWLERVLAVPFDGPTVVVTHHAPSPRSLGRGRVPSSPDPCYASALDAMVARSGAALWIHDHTHHCCDYRLGETGVINNGHGYGGENRGSYDPALVVEIMWRARGWRDLMEVRQYDKRPLTVDAFRFDADVAEVLTAGQPRRRRGEFGARTFMGRASGRGVRRVAATR